MFAEWVGTPQLSMLCYSPRVSPQKWSLFTHMPSVIYPIIWYYPLEYSLGDWKYEYGDTLVCQLWECDGAKDGCHPDRPLSLPNADAGDDLLGQATLSMGSFQILGSSLLNMTVPRNGKGTFGSQAASFLLECKGCRTLWQRDPSWVNPFTEKAEEEEKPKPSPTPKPSPSPKPDVNDKPKDQVIDEPDEPKQTEVPSPPPTKDQVIEASPPPNKEDPNEESEPENPKVDSFDSTDPQPTDLPSTEDIPTDIDGEESSSSGSNTLVIVLGALGALVGIVIVAVITYFCLKKCGWRAVHPDQEEEVQTPKKDEHVARHLRIRVQRPAEADAAMRQHQVDGAMAELPWAPRTAH